MEIKKMNAFIQKWVRMSSRNIFELTRHLPWKQGWSLLLKDLISKVAAAAAATLVEEGIEIGGELAPGEDMFDEPDIRRAE